ncbi:DUF5689 domain-containing protein, partial [Desulfurobacterium indicum]|uniref:DUF5689 domain-containing protein n=1 Tax=Desulfurobacterium indicum TaxID=1914305 RepID=UPI001C1F41CE
RLRKNFRICSPGGTPNGLHKIIDTTPIPVSIGDLSEKIGDLVQLNNVTVELVDTSSFVVSDGTNSVEVYCGKAGFNPSSLISIGDTVDVTGIVGKYKDTVELWPRSTSDIVKK